MMLENAREHGVERPEGGACWRCCSRASAPSACASQEESGAEREVRADVVVDASGQSSLIMSRLGCANGIQC